MPATVPTANVRPTGLSDSNFAIGNSTTLIAFKPSVARLLKLAANLV